MGKLSLPAAARTSKELRQLMLGFDVDPARTARLVAEWSQYCAVPADRDEITQDEDEILNIFVDICSLFQRQPEVEDPTSGEGPSAEAYLFSYLRMLDARGEGLPPAFVDALRRALAHYGVRTLDRSPRTGREFALDLQIAPTRGAASSAHSGCAGTASGACRKLGAPRRGILPGAPRPDDLGGPRTLSRR